MTDGGGDDASVDGGRPLGCIPVEEGDRNEATVTLDDGSTFPFAVRSAFATWRCDVTEEPDLLVGLTDGTCIPASGEQLVFAFDLSSIDTIFSSLGSFDVGPETGVDDPLTVRFYTPREGSPGADEWGTCAGAAGMVELEEIGVARGTSIRGTYDLTLTDCQGTSLPPVRVMGGFSVPLEFDRDAICG